MNDSKVSSPTDGSPSRRFIPATGWRVFLPLYDRLVGWFTPESIYRTHTLEQCQLQAGERALDVGCGTGTLLFELARRNPQATLFGLDPDAQILEMARRKQPAATQPQIRWLCGSATELPFEAESLDAVVTSLVFHHLAPREKATSLAEVYRVLRRGGELWLTDFARPSSLLQRLQYFAVQLIDGWNTTQCNALDRLPQLISSAGFDQVDEELACKSWLGTIRTYRAVKSS